LFVRFGEECSNITQEIESAIETVYKFWDFCKALIAKSL